MTQQTIDLGRVVASHEALAKVPARMAQKYGVLPVTLDEDCLTVVQLDPDDMMGPVHLEGQLGLEIRVLPTKDPSAVAQALRRYYPEASDGVQTPLVELEGIVNRAIQIHCSDVHLDPEDSNGVVRMRVDGMMRVEREIGRERLAELVSAIKVSARLDIAEKRIPQDGQLSLASMGEDISLRVATIPTLHGEKVTLRILATAQVAEELAEIDDLGMCRPHRDLFVNTLDQSHGAIVLSGPTGSGKTTTLYAALRYLRQPRTRHIVSIEDPVEIPLPGITQIRVDSERVGFASALRSVMRHDPDVIMIGEIRDKETADIAIKSSLTGHLVLSTLHANTSVAVVTRLLNLGIPRELLAATLRLVIAQRLVRCPCPHCMRWVAPSSYHREVFSFADVERIPQSAACPLCAQMGYAGRIGLYEMAPIGKAERQRIVEGAQEDELQAHLFGTMKHRTLFADGMAKVLDGLTTPEEVRRVTLIETEL